MPVILKIALGILVELLATKNYGHRAFQQHHEILRQESGYHLGVVEFDDEGQLFDKDPDSLSKLLDGIRDVASQRHTIIVVFVHGWHHNASERDENLRDFRTSLREISAALNTPQYVEVRRQYSGAPPSADQTEEVIGVYLGWRGKSEPMPLDYVTFWGRKAAAKRIGTGSAADVLTRLDQLHRRLVAKSLVAHKEQNTPLRFTGLVVVGHSFGGALALSAVESQFQATLARVAGDVRKDPAAPGERRFPLINGLGDLVVLVNPAIEASLYDGIFQAAQAARFPPSQVPVLLTVSADNDLARKFWFPTAQRLSSTFRATRTEAQEDQLRRALGEFSGHVTHRIEISKNGHKCPEGSNLDRPDLRPQDMHLGAAHSFKTGNDPDQEVCFFPIHPDADPDNPFLVATADKEIINGHNGVFDRNLKAFLVRFIAWSEAKRQKLFEHAGPAAPVQMYP